MNECEHCEGFGFIQGRDGEVIDCEECNNVQ